MRHFVKYDLIPLLSMLAVCAFPCLFLYARNAAEVPAASMLPFLIVFSANALLFFLLTLPVFRNASRAALWTDLAMLAVINFCLLAVNLKKLLPFFRDRYLMALIAALLVALAVLLIRKKPDLRTGCLLVLIAFGSLCVIHLGLAVPAVLGAHQVKQELEAPGDVPPPERLEFPGQARPNVYLFLFDEYGGYDNLLHYYGYDNGPFLRELEGLGFTVAYDSRNTEAIHTDTLVPNLLNLDYAVRVEEPYRKKAALRSNCRLYRIFKDNGYQVNLVNHVDYLGPAGCRVLTRNQTRRTISEYLMRNSLYNKSRLCRYWLDEFFNLDYGASYRASLDNAMGASLTCWQAAEENGCPTLTVGYLQFPHSPTMVGPHGEELPYANGWNWTDHSLYLGQVEYCNDFIRRLTAELQTHDPEALILLLSDHGNRYALHMTDIGVWDSYDPHVENPHMQNVLSCVYYQGQSFDVEGQTGINTLRRTLNQVFGTELPDVEPLIDFTDAAGDEQQ